MLKIVFRLTAAVAILLLLLQYYQKTQFEQRILREDESVTIASNLDVSSIRIKNDIYAFYKKTGRLPKFSQELECKSGDGCNLLEFNGIYYVTDSDVWMSFEPYFDGDKLKYECKVSRKEGLDMSITILKFCGVLDLSSVPYR